ncbi:hypothetical protein ACE1BG_07530 [Aeromonas veronii]|uniref:hypothetical protein n=1 Tax=Aeromonas veronii TaxID=654 RepID=UPI0035B97E8F
MRMNLKEVREFLEKMHFSMEAIASHNGGAMQRSDYLSLSQDVNEVNAVAAYVYCFDETNVALIQLSASKGNGSYLAETEKKFAALITELASFFSGANNGLPDVFELPTQSYPIGDYTLRVDLDDSQSNAFIALSASFEEAMETRKRLLRLES